MTPSRWRRCRAIDLRGGRLYDGTNPLAAVETYDPQQNRWEAVAHRGATRSAQLRSELSGTLRDVAHIDMTYVRAETNYSQHPRAPAAA